MELTREVCHQFLSTLADYTPEQIQEYINEAEHMEWYSYWSNFPTLEDLKDDVKLYFDNYLSDMPSNDPQG